MKKINLLISTLLVAQVLFSQNFWEKTYPVSTTQSVGRDLILSVDGATYLLGEIDFPAPTGQLKHYVRLLKIDPNDGNILWENIVNEGNNALEAAYSLREKADGSLLAVGFSGFPDTRMYCIHANAATGDTIFTKKIEATKNEVAYVVRTLPNGDFLVGGTRYELGKSAKLYRLTADGTIVWSNFYNISGTNHSEGIVDMEFSIDNNPILLHSQNHDISFSNIDNEGLLLGTLGNNYSNFDIPTSLSVAADGTFLISASVNGVAGNNPLIIKSSETEVLWTKNLPFLYFTVYSIETEADGGYLLGMSGKPSGEPKGKVVFLKLNSEGEILWKKEFEGDYERFVVKPYPTGGYIGIGTRNKEMLVIKTAAATDIPSLNSNNANVIIYPNPCIDFLALKFQNTDNQTIAYEIFDILGKKIYANYPENQGNVHKIDASLWPTGIYFLKGNVGDKNFNKIIEVVK
jgi:Secretion system C-terminal sorting domain